MNSRQLRKLGVPEFCVKQAIHAASSFAQSGTARARNVKQAIRFVLAAPDEFVNDKYFAPLAKALIEDRDFVRAEPITYRTWGEDGIDDQAHSQMRQACGVPSARGAALMPDAHVGYGLPIGGVLACENAVIPYAVGVDIALIVSAGVSAGRCRAMSRQGR